MKTANRRQVRTPVGNKTKRGAELEGTPKTPRPFETTPGKTSSVDGSSQDPEDRRMQLRSRRLQWNNIPKLGDGDRSGENVSSPHQLNRNYTAESKAVAALSPICVNAINGCSGQQAGGKKSGVQKSHELTAAEVVSPLISDRDSAIKRKCHGKALVNADWNIRNDEDDAKSTDSGSNASSPEFSSSGRKLLFWSNPAFNTQIVSISVDSASCRSCSASASSSQQNVATLEPTDSEAESKLSDEYNSSLGNCHINGRKEGAVRHKACDGTDPKPRLADIENQRLQYSNCSKNEKPDGVFTENISFGAETYRNGKISESEAGNVDLPSPAKKPLQAKRQCSLQNGGENEEEMKTGLQEIQQEIERLTERLAELHLQKKKREEEILRQTQEQCEKLRTSNSERMKAGDARNVEKLRQEKRAGAGTTAGRVKLINGASGRSTYARQSPKAAQQRSNGLSSKGREESPLASVARQCSAASVSKLSEMRRSVSSTGRRMERSNSDERTKALRRLSLSGAAASGSESKSQQQQGLKSVPCKGTPSTSSRVVSSRYGRAITPDACRPSAAGSAQQISSKGRDRPSASAVSSPFLTSSPLPSTSLTCSPVKRTTTPRSGYPSRSGFSTPTKDRQAMKPAAMVSTSMQILPSAPSSSLIKSQDRTRLLQSPRCMSPLPRLDSPKSTAALYKCLESLLEDSKHFFKCLSPARSNRLSGTDREPAAALASSPCVSARDCSPKQLLAAMEATLPTINTCRLDVMSPRDSGCVKRASDRQKKRSYFAMDECIPQALESS